MAGKSEVYDPILSLRGRSNWLHLQRALPAVLCGFPPCPCDGGEALVQAAARQPYQIGKHLLQACGCGLLPFRWQSGSHKDVLPLKLPAQTATPG